MVHLTVAGLSKDGRRLLLVSDAGVEFTVDVDARLRAALAGDHARLGQLEITMDSTLRPRDIQARIRAGESAEAVAQAAGTSVEKVMPYAAPVLAERAHVAERAQRASVRRRSGDTAGARTLGEAIGRHLRGRNVDPDSVEWDAWRREDGRWTLTATYEAGARSGTGHFSFDAPGNYVVVDDDDARWLLGEVGDDPAAEAHDDLSAARSRRLNVLPADELPLGEDALDLVAEDGDLSLGTEHDLDGYLDETASDLPVVTDDDPAEEPTEAPDARQPEPEPAADPSPTDEGEPAAKPKRRKGRASVPSWDEIMFGSGDSDH